MRGMTTKKTGYRELLQQFAKTYHCRFEERYTVEKSRHGKRYHHSMTMSSWKERWHVRGIGEDADAQMATIKALDNLLPAIKDHFLDATATSIHARKTLDAMISAVLRLAEEKQRELHPARKHKQTRFRMLMNQLHHQPWGDDPSDNRAPQNFVAPLEHSPKEVFFDGPAHTLYICKSALSCRQNGHTVESVTGVFASLRGTPLKVNVNYCMRCRMYFIGYQEYQHYVEYYGPLLGKIAIFFQDVQDIHDRGFGQIASESILRTCGYTVRQGSLTERERRRVLANIMDREIASKSCVMEHIQFFINSHHKQSNRKIAVAKWRSDLDWVRNYRIDTQRRFLIAGVRHA